MAHIDRYKYSRDGKHKLVFPSVNRSKLLMEPGVLTDFVSHSGQKPRVATGGAGPVFNYSVSLLSQICSDQMNNSRFLCDFAILSIIPLKHHNPLHILWNLPIIRYKSRKQMYLQCAQVLSSGIEWQTIQWQPPTMDDIWVTRTCHPNGWRRTKRTHSYISYAHHIHTYTHS